jgi:redox-sensitive bicupin YhaK (pirin superfamily)
MADPIIPDAIEAIIAPRPRDLGGFTVARVLPAVERRMVGPFVFLDQMGPADFAPGSGIDVRPHPHIGLATVTYLFRGEILHRDSLGSVQPIRPGEINWMTAGRGITHSERTPPAIRADGGTLAGMQSWVALPKDDEETAPSFAHHGAAALPVVDGEGRRVRVLIGTIYGARSPVRTFSETLYADVTLTSGATLQVPAEPEERALYLVDGTDRRRDGGAGATSCPETGRGNRRHRAFSGAADAARRREAGWAASPLVELRFQFAGAHRAGQGRLAGRPFPTCPRRRRVHSTADIEGGCSDGSAVSWYD